MKLADGIRKHGFRKWYERELLQSHAHMLLLLFCTIGLLGAFEVFNRAAPLANQLSVVASVLLCAGIGVWALRRYLYLLMHAETVANQAVCPACETYGRLTVLRDDGRRQELHVRCKHCNHEWTIST